MVALPAISLVDNPANVTAVANDLGYENLFARQIEGLGAPGDVLLAFTTSGSSPNILLAVKKAKGERVGNVPYGWRADADGKLQRDEAEQRAMKLARRLRAEGKTLRAIADALREAGHTPRTGKKWHVQVVKRIAAP